MASSLESLINRPRHNAWQEFWASPTVFIANALYKYSVRRVSPPRTPPRAISVVCISDTHNSQPELPEGDILIHAGDLTQSGSFKELETAIAWIRSQPHRHKIVIAGNHDVRLHQKQDRSPRDAIDRANIDWGDIVYLEDSTVSILCDNGRELRIYGSPMTRKHGNWAFQYPRGEDIWTGSIPLDTDILVTHGPPRAHLDLLNLGCDYLLGELWRVRPRLHVFGHVHEGYGQEWLSFDGLQAAFEGCVSAGGGLQWLVGVVWGSLQNALGSGMRARTLAVNAAMVGGIRDEKRRKPIQVLL